MEMDSRGEEDGCEEDTDEVDEAEEVFAKEKRDADDEGVLTSIMGVALDVDLSGVEVFPV